jgi:hypothetical protein
MCSFELYQRQSERLSTGNLKRELGLAGRALNRIAKEVDALIANDLAGISDYAFKSKTKSVRRLASQIRAMSEELAIREAA